MSDNNKDQREFDLRIIVVGMLILLIAGVFGEYMRYVQAAETTKILAHQGKVAPNIDPAKSLQLIEDQAWDSFTNHAYFTAALIGIGAIIWLFCRWRLKREDQSFDSQVSGMQR